MRRGNLHRPGTWPLMLAAMMAIAPLLIAAKGCGRQSSQSCDERIDAAWDYVDSVIRDNSSCTVNADCVGLYPSTDCMGVCMQAVNQAGVEAVNSAILYANQQWCQGFTDDGCGYATPSCIAQEALCRDGQCVADVVGSSSSASRVPAR